MRKLIRNIVLAALLILVVWGGAVVIKRLIRPYGTVLLSGNYDPSITRVYVDGAQITTKDVSTRAFRYSGKAGNHQIIIAGPGIKTVKTSMVLKPFLGATKKFALSPAGSVSDIVYSFITPANGSVIASTDSYGSSWIGASVVNPDQDPSLYAFHYDYGKAAWVVLDPDPTKLDVHNAAFKGAPQELIYFLTDTGAD